MVNWDRPVVGEDRGTWGYKTLAALEAFDGDIEAAKSGASTAVSTASSAAAAASVASGKADGAVAEIAAVKPRTEVKAVGQGELVFNLKDFGAAGDGVTDDSGAVQEWLDAVLAQSSGAYSSVGYAPPGDYLLSEAVTGYAPSKKFALYGAGVGVSRFIVAAENDEGGILIDAPGARDGQCTVHDLSIVARCVGTGTGFRYALEAGGNQHQRSLIMRNVEVKSDNRTSHVFDIGIDATGNWRPHFACVVVAGPTVGMGHDDEAVNFVGTAGIVLDDSYEYLVTDSHVWSYHTLIRDDGTGSEAGRIHNCQLVGGRVGIYRKRTGDEPHFEVANSHVSCRDVCVDIDGGKIIFIQNCHFYNQDGPNPNAPSQVAQNAFMYDIRLRHQERAVITGNIFHFEGNPERVNVEIDPTVKGLHVVISNNVFGSGSSSYPSENAIHVGAGASNVLVQGNIYPGGYAKRIVDDSATAAIMESAGGTSPNWRIESHNDDNGVSPAFRLLRDSDTPAAGDQIGGYIYTGKDSAGGEVDYVTVRGVISDPNSASRDSELQFFLYQNNSNTRFLQLSPAATASDTCAYLAMNISGTLTLKRVVVGPADSAGTGFRALRVAN